MAMRGGSTSVDAAEDARGAREVLERDVQELGRQAGVRSRPAPAWGSRGPRAPGDVDHPVAALRAAEHKDRRSPRPHAGVNRTPTRPSRRLVNSRTRTDGGVIRRSSVARATSSRPRSARRSGGRSPGGRQEERVLERGSDRAHRPQRRGPFQPRSRIVPSLPARSGVARGPEAAERGPARAQRDRLAGAQAAHVDRDRRVREAGRGHPERGMVGAVRGTARSRPATRRPGPSRSRPGRLYHSRTPLPSSSCPFDASRPTRRRPYRNDRDGPAPPSPG